jgi:hypothetical protein
MSKMEEILQKVREALSDSAELETTRRVIKELGLENQLARRKQVPVTDQQLGPVSSVSQPEKEPINIIETLCSEHEFGEWYAKHIQDQKFLCIYCDRDFLASYDDYNSMQHEHIIPLSGGGENSFDNMAVACKTCNFIKQTYMPTGIRRSELIADARRHVQMLRSNREVNIVAPLRLLVRGSSAEAQGTAP